MARLDPSPPIGSIYFSQGHSLRWMKSGQADPEVLYREILSHALFFECIIFSDSHAIQNWLLMELLPGGAHSAIFPGLDKLFQLGVIRLARRIEGSLEETTYSQIARRVPVLVGGEMKEMSEQFLRHSERLMRLSDGNEFYYDPREIQLAELILQNVLDSNSVSTAYGIKSAKTRMEIEKTVHKLQRTNGRLLASELFRFPEKQSGPLSNAKNKELVQILATSAHSCAMPLTFELMPTMSPHSDDFRGAIALYQNFVPQIQKIRTDQDAFKKGALDPSILIPSDGKDLTKMGVEPILRLRQTKEFRRLQLERKKLLDFYDSKNAGQLVVPEEMEQETAFGKALANYLARILEEYNLKWLPAENPESAVLKRLIYETDNKITEIMTEISTAGTLYAGVASVLTVLAAFGVVPLAMMLAGGGIVTAGVLNRRRVLKHLRSDRKDFNKASSLVNISKKHTS